MATAMPHVPRSSLRRRDVCAAPSPVTCVDLAVDFMAVARREEALACLHALLLRPSTVGDVQPPHPSGLWTRVQQEMARLSGTVIQIGTAPHSFQISCQEDSN